MRCELLAESKEHKAWPLLCQIPLVGPIRPAVLMGIVQTPYRFRTKRQMLSFNGLGSRCRAVPITNRWPEGSNEGRERRQFAG